MPVNTSALLSLATQQISGTFYRLVRTKYAGEPLSMYGAYENGGRYNVTKLFGALYLGFDKATCHAEITQGILAGCPIKSGAFTLWSYDVQLTKIVRLDDADNLAKIGTTREDITRKGDHWTARDIGEPLFNKQLEGLVAPSAHKDDDLCLDVYLDHLAAASKVIPANSSLWPGTTSGV